MSKKTEMNPAEEFVDGVKKHNFDEATEGFDRAQADPANAGSIVEAAKAAGVPAEDVQAALEDVVLEETLGSITDAGDDLDGNDPTL